MVDAVRSRESIGHPWARGARRLVRAGWLVGVLGIGAAIGGCSTGVSPSIPAETGTVRVTAIRAADDNTLFGALPRARLWTTNGPAPVEWALSLEEPRAIEAPIGSYTLSTFSWYLTDTIRCDPAPNGGPGETCFQPTMGPSLTCDLPVTVTQARVVEATFHLLAEGRCRLDAGAPAGSPESIPGASR
jgi:hypothetical protein